MKSLSKVLKAQTVKVDSDKKIHIDVGFTPVLLNANTTPESMFEESPEEIAQAIINNANREAQQLLTQTRREANVILSDARRDAAKEIQSLRNAAQKEGHEEGLRQAEAEGARIRAEAARVLADAEQSRRETEQAIEPAMVDLIDRIVQKLLGETVRINPGVIVNLIRQGFAGATITGDVFVHVSQQDYEQVVQNKDALMALADGSVNLEIIRDLSLEPTDCVIETPYGDIDCSLQPQFEALRDQLAYILQNR